MSAPVSIDFISDVVCPWCALGATALEEAIDNLAGGGKRSHFYNTFDAHRLLFWALQQGRQIELKKSLLRGYFSDGQNVSDHETLARLAAEAGLDIEGARKVLGSTAYANEVRELEVFYREHGINSVPAMVLNGRQLVSGSQSVSYYEQMLREMSAAAA